MDYNNYNHLRNTDTYRFLRDVLGFSRETAIRTILLIRGTGMLLRNLFIAALLAAMLAGIFLLFQQLREKSNEWNEELMREQQERQRSGETEQNTSYQGRNNRSYRYDTQRYQ